MEDSTKVGNIEEEIFLALWCDTDVNDEKVHSRMLIFQF